jgi:hypothetical protein
MSDPPFGAKAPHEASDKEEVAKFDSSTFESVDLEKSDITGSSAGTVPLVKAKEEADRDA